MAAVPDIAADIGKMHEQGGSRIAHRLVELADLEGDDRLDAGGERRVSGGERIVELEIPPFSASENSYPSRNIASITSACLITWCR